MATSLQQELPRKGGYAPIDFAKNVPKRGPSGYIVILGGIGVMAYGFYHVVQGNRKMCEIRKERLNARIALLPLLQAETDRRVLRTLKENEQEEALIMKNVKNWKVGESVYNTTKWVTPIPEQFEKY